MQEFIRFRNDCEKYSSKENINKPKQQKGQRPTVFTPSHKSFQ